jgi:ABC-2 type transport system permease protein
VLFVLASSFSSKVLPMKPKPPVSNTPDPNEMPPDSYVSYDSSRATGFRTILVYDNFRYYFQLLKLLIRKDLSARYQRSFLGIWWGVVNPVFTSLVLYIVFHVQYSSKLANGIPFGPYILGGTLVVAMLGQGCVSATQSLQSSSQIFIRLPAPPVVFAMSAATVAGINFLFGLFPLLVWNTIAGGHTSIGLILLPYYMLVAIVFLTGMSLIGLVLVSRFGDTINLMTLIATLMTFVTPVFYPIDALSARGQFLINLNPLTHFVNAFRFSVLDIGIFELKDWIFISLISFTLFIFGLEIFYKTWQKTATLL